MAPIGDDSAVVEQDDPVGQADGGQPVGDDERRAAVHERAESAVDLLLDVHVNGARGVVEDEDRRVHEEGAGDRDPLALTTGEGVAAFSDHGVVALRQVLDELVGVGRPGGSLDLLLRGCGLP